MNFDLITYLIGSFYIINTLFHVSNKLTSYLFKKEIIKLPMYKYDKINEVIYSSAHSILVTFFCYLCFDVHTIDYYNYFNYQLINNVKDNDLMIVTFSFILLIN